MNKIVQWHVWNSKKNPFDLRDLDTFRLYIILYIIHLSRAYESTNCVLHFVQWLMMLPRGHPHQSLRRCLSLRQGNVHGLQHWSNECKGLATWAVGWGWRYCHETSNQKDGIQMLLLVAQLGKVHALQWGNRVYSCQILKKMQLLWSNWLVLDQ